jgi:hypothetical protein
VRTRLPSDSSARHSQSHFAFHADFLCAFEQRANNGANPFKWTAKTLEEDGLKKHHKLPEVHVVFASTAVVEQGTEQHLD